jgi:hypothetical protein
MGRVTLMTVSVVIVTLTIEEEKNLAESDSRLYDTARLKVDPRIKSRSLQYR